MGSEVTLDHPGEVIHWFKSEPEEIDRRPVGPCPHTECRHHGQSVVAWGPDFEHYELMVCDDDHPGGCAGWCRGWQATDDNEHGGTHGKTYRRRAPTFMLLDRPPKR
jgi:hypothetical protein